MKNIIVDATPYKHVMLCLWLQAYPPLVNLSWGHIHMSVAIPTGFKLMMSSLNGTLQDHLNGNYVYCY